MSRTYDPAVHFNFDENKRRLWNDPWTKEQNLSGFMNWEIAKVSFHQVVLATGC